MEEARVAEAPAHVGAVLSLTAQDEDRETVAVGEALDLVVHRVRQEAPQAMPLAVASSLQRAYGAVLFRGRDACAVGTCARYGRPAGTYNKVGGEGG